MTNTKVTFRLEQFLFQIEKIEKKKNMKEKLTFSSLSLVVIGIFDCFCELHSCHDLRKLKIVTILQFLARFPYFFLIFLKGHPHASIMYQRFWAEFLAVRSKYYGWLREFPDKSSNFGLLYGRVYGPLEWNTINFQDENYISALF